MLVFYLNKKQISVIGYNASHCSKQAYEIAYQIGEEVALHQAILITGGLGGVMEASSKGAQNKGGLVIGIIPQSDKVHANPYCDVVISTGLGHARNFLTAYSGDAVIVVGGGVGTAIEAKIAYLKAKSIIAIKGGGGVADEIGGKYLDDRCLTRVLMEEDPLKAVDQVLKLIAF
jgi:uncharacterized protein (TIGR00725 family)